jgi:TM2 domain-containing membrane protein YozV
MERTAIAALTLTLIAGSVNAGTLDQTLGTNRQQVNPEHLILKDPMIAGLMSASLPGLGQIYAGERKKGFTFLFGTIGAFAGTAAFAYPANLDLIDYDRAQYGGNGDGFMSTAELQNWEDEEFQDEAFEDLSTGRKVGAITTAATGLGLYIWNIIDARSSARSYNREVMQRRFDLGMTASENQTGLALNLHF